MSAHRYPLEAVIKHSARKARERREWLENKHALNPRCRYCGLYAELKPKGFDSTKDADCESRHATLDHIVPRSAGGPDHPRNWALACGICNNLKADMPEAEFIEWLKMAGVR